MGIGHITAVIVLTGNTMRTYPQTSRFTKVRDGTNKQMKGPREPRAGRGGAERVHAGKESVASGI